MRLRARDIEGIAKALREYKPLNGDFELYLFGSRTDDQKRGGDIDLLLVVPDSMVDKMISEKHLLVSQAKRYIEDQRVDIVIRTREDLTTDPFCLSIQSQLMRLV